ncbi:UNVERIFIED_CONTAM: putative serine/threonine-protein kinase PBL28 [Sesamum calycinum]|uniref:Serine/threonine-protein kinase PBL28 n=1 Tax=Sesamum calycinum TaxID=2727403 RepID=A0AAW2PQV8_9LAMI
MDWPLRLKVALGAARGLAYLHSSSDVGIPIVHRDFKSTNILLDDNYEAKLYKQISDFGLAKLMPEGQETCMTATVLGTFGYFDPEYTLRLNPEKLGFKVEMKQFKLGPEGFKSFEGGSRANRKDEF